MPGDPSEFGDDAFGARFQSAPDINAGRSRICAGWSGWRTIVSIRARHQCRAILVGWSITSPHGLVSIRARHQCRAIHGPAAPHAAAMSFNPRPTSMPGDPGRRCSRNLWRMCFNPRPTSMPGDPFEALGYIILARFQSAPDINAGRSLHPGMIGIATYVSIRARHQCRAIQTSGPTRTLAAVFQSAPDINAGRSETLKVSTTS